jgi:hypothetical protein
MHMAERDTGPCPALIQKPGSMVRDQRRSRRVGGFGRQTGSSGSRVAISTAVAVQTGAVGASGTQVREAALRARSKSSVS